MCTGSETIFVSVPDLELKCSKRFDEGRPLKTANSFRSCPLFLATVRVFFLILFQVNILLVRFFLRRFCRTEDVCKYTKLVSL